MTTAGTWVIPLRSRYSALWYPSRRNQRPRYSATSKKGLPPWNSNSPGAPVAAGLSCIFGFADWQTNFADVLETLVKTVEPARPQATALIAAHSSTADP